MEKETPMTNEQSLKIIQQMISTAQQNVTESGFHFLMWGFLNVSAALLNYVLLKMHVNESAASLPWIGMLLIGAPGSIIYEKRKDKRIKHQTFTDHFYFWIWISFGISMFTSIVYANVYQINSLPLILILAGFATLVSGAVLQFNPLKLGGFAFFASAIAACFCDNENGLLLFALAISLGYIIPGILLSRKFHNSQKRV